MTHAANTTKNNHVERTGRLTWVPISKMAVSAVQAERYQQSHVDYLVANLDLELIGAPVVNERDGVFWIMDGQHRIATLRAIGWGDQQVQCWTYHGMTLSEEHDWFLKLNHNLTVGPFTKFRAAVSAGYEVECDIDRVVRVQGMVVSRDKIPGAIGAVGTLRRVYTRGGPSVLRETLCLIRDAYGDAGLTASIIDGVALLVQRYGPELDLIRMKDKLSTAHGGTNGLLNLAENLRRQTGNGMSHCVAAAAVEIYNRGRGGAKIATWWNLDSRGGLVTAAA